MFKIPTPEERQLIFNMRLAKEKASDKRELVDNIQRWLNCENCNNGFEYDWSAPKRLGYIFDKFKKSLPRILDNEDIADIIEGLNEAGYIASITGESYRDILIEVKKQDDSAD